MLTPRRISAVAAATAAATLAFAAGSAGAHPLNLGHDQFGQGQSGPGQSGPSQFGHGPSGPGQFGGGSNGPAGDVFVQTDGLSGNAVDVYDRSSAGQLTLAGSYPTGGNGGQATGSAADFLASQNSLVYDSGQNELLAVNAGSNTISAFDVYGDHLHLRQVVSSGGTFPASIAVHGNLVYVLNATGGGSIQGYWLLGGNLVPIPGSNRALGLNPNATPQFLTTPGDIAFTPDGRDLLVSTKVNTSSIDVFGVNWLGQPAAQPVVNSEPGAVPFAFAFTSDNQVAVTEAGTDSVANFTLNGDGTLTQVGASVATGQQATCWIVADGPALFAGNAGSNTESVLTQAPFGSLQLTQTAATDAGTIDATTSSDGRYLYVQTGVAGTVDEYQVGFGGTLTQIGSVAVPTGAGQEGIAAS